MNRLQTKNQKVVMGILVGLLLIFTITYSARGWLRGPFVSWTATKLYAAQIDQAFANDIAPINPNLKTLGIVLDNSGADHNGNAACYDGNFHVLRETINCSHSANNYVQDLPMQLNTKWPTESDKIKNILKDRSWQIDRHTWRNDARFEEDLGKLIDPSRSTVEVVYFKKANNITCILDFRYDPPSENLHSAITVSESCWRVIHLFGGY